MTSGARPWAVFFDRDGTLIEDLGYQWRPEDIRLTPGAGAAVRAAKAAGALAILATNQSGIARGLFTEADLWRFHAVLQERLLDENGAALDAIYYCPYHDEAIVPAYRHPNHPDRKPNPGMMLRAAEDFNLDLSRSLMIGDKEIDVEAAARAGMRGLLFTGGDISLVLASALEAAAPAP